MSRLTGTDAYSLMEAYQAVYSPQELTEEQVWEEVETWVNSLVEEGYDLSDYTWEEMYESYLSEMGQTRTTGQMTAPKVAPTPTSRPQVAGGGMGGMRGSGRDRNATQTSSSPGALRVPAPSPRSAAPAPRSAAPAAPAAPARPVATAPATPKPTATTTPTPAPSTPRQKDTSITDMIGRSQVRQGATVNTGSSTSDARAISARASVGATPKPAPSTATAKPTPRQARLNMEMEYDTFDTVLEYLVAEGYADTEESALVIMANMSEDWREEILKEGKSDRPLGIMHSFARGMKQKKGEKGEDKYGQDSEGNITGKYTKMQKSKRS